MIQVLDAFTFFFHTSVDDFVVEMTNFFQMKIQLLLSGRKVPDRFLQNLIGPIDKWDSC